MNIQKVAMKKDPNNKWELEVYVDQAPSITMAEIYCEEDSHFHYGEDENGFVRFGVSYDEKYMGHEAGYMWSSRCGVFNTAFGKKLIEITLCTASPYGGYSRWGCYYMTVDKALELIPDDFHISMFDDNGEDVFLYIKDGEPDEHWCYKYVCPMFI